MVKIVSDSSVIMTKDADSGCKITRALESNINKKFVLKAIDGSSNTNHLTLIFILGLCHCLSFSNLPILNKSPSECVLCYWFHSICTLQGKFL